MTNMGDPRRDRSGYAPVNGLNMYYEIHGTGRPLVLLHGAFSAIGTSFQKLLPDLATTRQVIAFEMQAHGHTADIDRPLSLETHPCPSPSDRAALNSMTFRTTSTLAWACRPMPLWRSTASSPCHPGASRSETPSTRTHW
jgi:pimeloyl-ACP methyl ester carboxylesterase